MPRRTGTGTKIRGVKKHGPNRYLVRGKARNEKTGRMVEIERIVEARSVADAARRRSEILDEARSLTERPQRTRLGDFAESWLRQKMPEWKPSTLETNVVALERYIGPALGDFYLDAITTDDIVRFREGMKSSNNTSKNSRMRVLRALLKAAVLQRLLPSSPADLLRTLPETRTSKGWTAVELRRLFSAAKTHSPLWYPHFYTLAMTGLRFGEFSAVRWSDIHDGRVIEVGRSQWKGEIGSTKTGVIREVALSAGLAELLRERRAEMLRAQDPSLGGGLVFGNRNGELLKYPAQLNRPLKQVLKVAGLPSEGSCHWFRHTFNNLARQQSSDPAIVQAMTGHSSNDMLVHYSEVGLAEKANVVALMERQLTQSGGSGGGTPPPNENPAGEDVSNGASSLS